MQAALHFSAHVLHRTRRTVPQKLAVRWSGCVMPDQSPHFWSSLCSDATSFSGSNPAALRGESQTHGRDKLILRALVAPKRIWSHSKTHFGAVVRTVRQSAGKRSRLLLKVNV